MLRGNKGSPEGWTQRVLRQPGVGHLLSQGHHHLASVIGRESKSLVSGHTQPLLTSLENARVS